MGTSFVQFDLRFYVVALLFIIFDVEVAFFFPWATVFGKATHLSQLARSRTKWSCRRDGELRLTAQADAIYRELGVQPGDRPARRAAESGGSVSDDGDRQSRERAADIVRRGARQLACDDRGYCRVLRRVVGGLCLCLESGDLDWVRAFGYGDRADGVPDAGARDLGSGTGIVRLR